MCDVQLKNPCELYRYDVRRLNSYYTMFIGRCYGMSKSEIPCPSDMQLPATYEELAVYCLSKLIPVCSNQVLDRIIPAIAAGENKKSGILALLFYPLAKVGSSTFDKVKPILQAVERYCLYNNYDILIDSDYTAISNAAMDFMYSSNTNFQFLEQFVTLQKLNLA